MPSPRAPRAKAKIAFGCIMLTASGVAEEVSAPKSAPQAESTIALSVFEVSSQRDTRYYNAQASTAVGTGLAIADTPIAISVVTKEFVQDINPLEIRGALEYSAGVETGSQRIGSFDYSVRGFRAPVVGDNGTVDFITPEFLERMEVTKGANALFFGQV